ncbi:DSD1 family PLP-dependent enzyme [Georgenia yuyongxinii]|uniref:DSD1 family PLP-dependent enzyme n=1 Tax=Georgenia yuyongxinii TaxID=2589797 RepID=A0A5B8CC16_9MICO|nr:alanine racemase [Georgenia yuyongxinii]QDC25696.1 DSD1 family PLP-dependent enzyme [Georgenia yuyongxinii]
MMTSLVGQHVDALDTPALLIDRKVLLGNIEVIGASLRKLGTAWRPHAKAHKSPSIAHLLLEAGAHGITCAKTSEAEIYAASGIRDILIANQVVGPIKTRRLAQLARQADIAVAVDCLENALEHDAAAAEAGTSPRLVIEINSGMNRAGIDPGDDTVELAKRIVALKHVRFGGVMTWEGHTTTVVDPAAREQAIHDSLAPVLESVLAIQDAGIDVPIVSCGGTGTFRTTAGIEGVTEVQAGGGIFGDQIYRALGVPVQPALSLLVTVTSRPAPDRVIIDAGRKSLDPTAALPEVQGLSNVQSMSFSAEHGIINLSAPTADVRIGDRLQLLIGYSDQAVHLHEQFFVLDGNTVSSVWPTWARGRLQ